jgi:hypothetical protein
MFLSVILKAVRGRHFWTSSAEARGKAPILMICRFAAKGMPVAVKCIYSELGCPLGADILICVTSALSRRETPIWHFAPQYSQDAAQAAPYADFHRKPLNI